AHLHYVLIGGMMFPMFAGLYHWLPLASGRMPSEVLGRAGFWLVFLGFNLTFLPMHLTGMAGLPRRVYTYAPELGVSWLNLLSTAAGFALAVGVVAILVDLALCFRHGRTAPANPWHAGSLEWAMAMPPQPYNFAAIPRVDSGYPLWDDPELPRHGGVPRGLLSDASHGQRELMGTGMLDARPQQVIRVATTSWAPILAALAIAVLLGFFIAKAYLAAALTLLPLLGILAWWLWTTGDRNAPARIEAEPGLWLPVQAAAPNAPGWWATVIALLIDGSLFASLVFAYFYLWLNAPAWPAPPAATGPLLLPLLAAALLPAAAFAGSTALRRSDRGQPRGLRLWLLLASVAGAAYVAAQALVLAWIAGDPTGHAYSSVVWTLAGFHWVHVAVTVLISAFVWARSAAGLVDAGKRLEPRIAAALWRYVAAQGLVAWAVIHVFPRMTT